MKTLQIPIEERYKNKNECIKKAKEVISAGLIDMNVDDCAKEIYAHAYIFWGANKIRRFIPKIPEELIKHANPVDLIDGGDTPTRRRIYDLIWNWSSKT